MHFIRSVWIIKNLSSFNLHTYSKFTYLKLKVSQFWLFIIVVYITFIISDSENIILIIIIIHLAYFYITFLFKQKHDSSHLQASLEYFADCNGAAAVMQFLFHLIKCICITRTRAYRNKTHLPTIEMLCTCQNAKKQQSNRAKQLRLHYPGREYEIQQMQNQKAAQDQQRTCLR